MEYIRQIGVGEIYAVKYDKHHNNKAGSTSARMDCTDRSATGKRSDDPEMVQRKRYQAQHVIQPLPIDNNRAENAIRPFAVGRKNWLFSNTANGAKASAALYSIISTAQANGLDAEKYLTELFSQPAGTILLPWEERK